jgi:hypothetical protein
MREVFERLESLEIGYFLTGSEAASMYGSIRQSFDTDIVIDLDPSAFGVIAGEFAGPFLVIDPIDFGDFSMASVIHVETAAKVDLIMRRPGPWANSVMSRRRRGDHPTFGTVWVSTVEDLILAKLMWSEGISELQLRDCAILIRLNRDEIDWDYTIRWAAPLGIGELLQQVRNAA